MAGGSKNDTSGSKKKAGKRPMSMDEEFDAQHGTGATSLLMQSMNDPTGAFARTSASDPIQWNPHLFAPVSQAQNPPTSSSYPLFPHLSQQLPPTTPFGALYPQHPPFPNFQYNSQNPQQNLNVSQPPQQPPQYSLSPEVVALLARMSPAEQSAFFRAMTQQPPQQPPQPIHIQQSQVFVTEPLAQPRMSVSRVPSHQSSHSLDHGAAGSGSRRHGSQHADSSHRQSAQRSRRKSPATELGGPQPTPPPPPPTAPLYGPMTGPPPGVDEPCGGRHLGSIPGRNALPPVINQGDYPDVPVRSLSNRAPNPTPQINRLRDRPYLTVG